MAEPTPRFDRAIGRYVYLEIQGREYRVYFEEAGQGIPLLLQHTAGADGRQWRHLLEEPHIAERYRLIAYDLPYHGRSLPPEGVEWCGEEYLDFPAEFRSVIGLEAGLSTPGGFTDIWSHPRVSNAFKASVMYGLMSPTSPEARRRETAWIYSQGAPPVFKGDLYYYSVDHDLEEDAERIDTSQVPVYILTGEYDWSATPEMSAEAASRIKGASYRTMEGLGHFPMSEDPKRFLEFIAPVLEEIAERSAR